MHICVHFFLPFDYSRIGEILRITHICFTLDLCNQPQKIAVPPCHLGESWFTVLEATFLQGSVTVHLSRYVNHLDFGMPQVFLSRLYRRLRSTCRPLQVSEHRENQSCVRRLLSWASSRITVIRSFSASFATIHLYVACPSSLLPCSVCHLTHLPGRVWHKWPRAMTFQ